MDESEKVLADRGDMMRKHVHDYIETDGDVGYVRDMTAVGGSPVGLHLVLRTIGRKSGRVMLVPLLYASWVDEFVIVASKAGSPKHPDWYLNLTSRPEVEFQVRNKRYAGRWRVAEGQEREVLWDYVSTSFTSYSDYQKRTDRVLPVVVLTPEEPITERWTVPEDALANVGRSK